MRSQVLAALVFLTASCGYAADLRVTTFRVDVTPPLGEPNTGNAVIKKVDDPLWAKGIVLDDGHARYVICAMDWCSLANEAELYLQTRVAEAAGTDPSKVAIQTVHQHSAPSVSSMDEGPSPDPKRPRFSSKATQGIGAKMAAAVKESLAHWQPFDSVGTGQARVDRLASARRLLTPEGKVLTRWSTSGSDPAMAAAPEGKIDPMLRTVTLARGNKPIVRLHYYATHPQTFCCDGRVSADIVGQAREALERKEKVFEVYFTGAAGDITVGKYNNETAAARDALASRLFAAMDASAASTRYEPAKALLWRTASLTLPPATHRDAKFRNAAPRTRPFTLSSLEIGKVSIVHLPGEPMLEFQLYAQQFRPNRFVAVAGLGDHGTGYICTDQVLKEGGYEPSVARGGPGSEAALKTAIRQLLGE